MVARGGPIREANQDSAAARRVRARAMEGPQPSNHRDGYSVRMPLLQNRGFRFKVESGPPFP